MISLGYRQSQGDHTLFIKHSPDGKLTLFLVYVDDMTIIGDDEIEKLTLKEKLGTQFEMKEGCIFQTRYLYLLKYVLDLLKETGKLRCKTLGSNQREVPILEIGRKIDLLTPTLGQIFPILLV
ncbi:hypothetical protein CR513_14781, partial [Mucuna pruriens]